MLPVGLLWWMHLIVQRLAQRINDVQERKTAKIGIPRADSGYSVLAHYHRSVQVVGKIATSIWVFRGSLGEHSRVTLCRR